MFDIFKYSNVRPHKDQINDQIDFCSMQKEVDSGHKIGLLNHICECVCIKYENRNCILK